MRREAIEGGGPGGHASRGGLATDERGGIMPSAERVGMGPIGTCILGTVLRK